MSPVLIKTTEESGLGAAAATPSIKSNQTGRRGSSSVKKRNSRRVQKARLTADFLRNLPAGVTYSPLSNEDKKKEEEKAKANEKNLGKNAGDIVRVGDFIFDISIVEKSSLISMRKFLPSEEYRLLKNRKSARLCRLKRKKERGSMKVSLVEVEQEMKELRDELEATKLKLAKSEKKR